MPAGAGNPRAANAQNALRGVFAASALRERIDNQGVRRTPPLLVLSVLIFALLLYMVGGTMTDAIRYTTADFIGRYPAHPVLVPWIVAICVFAAGSIIMLAFYYLLLAIHPHPDNQPRTKRTRAAKKEAWRTAGF